MTQKTGKIISRAKALKISRKFLIDAEKERIKIAAIEASKGEKMKLSELAKKAARLPHLEFDWAGVEQWNEESFTDNINNFDDLLSYTKSLKKRVSDQSFMLCDLAKAYEQLKEIILDADIES